MSQERVRVLHAITRLDRGGSAENTLLTAARLDAGRFAVTLAKGPAQGPPSPTEERARQAGVVFAEVAHLVRAIRPWADLRALWELWKLMRGGDFHIVHTHTSKAGFLGRLSARLNRVPVVVHTPHGHVFYGYYGPLLTRLFAYLERWAAGFTDRIVALTEKGAQDHVDFGVAGREKFAVIHSGVDFALAAQEGSGREGVRRELGIPAGALVVGTLGRLTAVKGQGDLVEAFARVRAQVQNAWLLLVGDGEERGNLEARARELGVEGCTVLAGWRQEVFALLRAMDIFALPSRNEGMGKALVEAMFAGLPCVATRVGGIPELVRHGQEGLLVEPGCADQLAEALVELALDAEKRACMGQAGRARAPAYGVEQMLEKLEALYEELLVQKGVACLPG